MHAFASRQPKYMGPVYPQDLTVFLFPSSGWVKHPTCYLIINNKLITCFLIMDEFSCICSIPFSVFTIFPTILLRATPLGRGPPNHPRIGKYKARGRQLAVQLGFFNKIMTIINKEETVFSAGQVHQFSTAIFSS